MKKMLKVLLTVALMLCLSFIVFQTFSEASYSSEMKNLINKDYEDTTGASNTVTTISATIITSIRIIAVAIAIVVLFVLAMKYMMAAPGDKADIKKSAITFVIGAIVVFGAIQLLELISLFSKTIK